MDPAADSPLAMKISQLKDHLGAWTLTDWLVFFIGIPLLLDLVYILPEPVKSQYFIFSTWNVFALHTYLLSAYTHSELFPHLVSNLAVYLIAMSAIFTFEHNRYRFYLMAAAAFLLVPAVCSMLTICLWHMFGTNTSMQGFSGIDAALVAYAFMAGVTWFLSEKLEVFDYPEAFDGSRGKYLLTNALLAFMLGMIVFAGIELGFFANTGTAITNGIAHFGGFMTGLIVFLAYDLRTEHRRGFDTMLSISILVGLASYCMYLGMIIREVRGG